jgi:hypothetical protein
VRAARRALPDVLAAVAVAVAIRLVVGAGNPDFDALYALAWGEDLAAGRSPELELPYAPAAHPLFVALAVLVAPLGDAGSAEALRWLVLLAAGAMCVGVARLGQALWSLPVGALAAALLATRLPTLHFADLAFVDLPATALVVWAAVLEARSPRRGAAVLWLLLLAGLLRPEMWLLAGAYWLWCAPALAWPGRLRLAAVVVAGPLMWALWELVLTGDALRPLTERNADPALVGVRGGGLSAAPEALARDLGGFLQAHVLVLALAGLVLALRVAPRRAALPIALAGLNALAFLVLAARDLPFEQRYLFVAGAATTLLAAYGALGWTALGDGDARRRAWRVAGSLALAAVAVVAAVHDRERALDLRERVRLADRAYGDLRALVEEPAAARALGRAPGAFMVTARPVPFVALHGERPVERLAPRPPAIGEAGVLLLPATQPAEQLLVRALPEPDKPVDLRLGVPGGWRLVARTRSWSLWEGGPVR